MTGRGVLAIAVLAAWGVGISMFARREMSRSASDRLAESAMRVSPVATWFAIRDGERHAGFASFTTDTVTDGLQFTEYTVRDAAPGGAPRRVVRQVVARATRSLVLRDVSVSDGGPAVTASVADDSTLLVVRERADGSDTTRQRFTPPLLLPSLVPVAVALGERPEVGDRHAWDVFDARSSRVRRLAVAVRAESSWVVVDSAAMDGSSGRWLGAHADTVRAWHLVEEGGGGLDVWVDEMGQTVAAREPGGMTLRRTAYEVAFENWRAAGRRARGEDEGDGMRLARSASANPAARVRQLTLLVAGLPLDKLAARSPWQAARGDTLRVRHPARGSAPNGYWLPPHRDVRTRFTRELQVEPGVEVDAPAIVDASRRLRAREPDPVTFAIHLTRWISDSVDLEPTLSPPSALATLRSRAGDADHHTHLFLALARASGLPARAVRGILRRDGQWLSHSWAEVQAAGEWLPVDPTYGQFPADAGHVRLTIGGLGARAELDRLVSRARITVLTESLAVHPRRPSR